jgi:hypothetical protein
LRGPYRPLETGHLDRLLGHRLLELSRRLPVSGLLGEVVHHHHLPGALLSQLLLLLLVPLLVPVLVLLVLLLVLLVGIRLLVILLRCHWMGNRHETERQSAGSRR